jgi:TetR/AcrR family transcriptional repressor of nem operon
MSPIAARSGGVARARSEIGATDYCRCHIMTTEQLGEPRSMRDQIKALAEDLLIQHGYRGVSFGDLAKILGMTRANIHYHFGNKQSLVEEVLDDYVRLTSSTLRDIWTASDMSLARKIEAMTEYSRKRYIKYNPLGKKGRPWSLIARMRQDGDALTPRARAALKQFGRDLNASIVAAIEEASARNELAPWLPVEDVALLLVSIANSAGPITQDAGSFDRLEALYGAFARIMSHAFGQEYLGPKSRRRAPLR